MGTFDDSDYHRPGTRATVSDENIDPHLLEESAKAVQVSLM